VPFFQPKNNNTAARFRCSIACPQVSVVDGKPFVCIDMGEGKPDLQAVEEKLLVEMHSITRKQGQKAAQQAQFIIVGSDLPRRGALSTISEGTVTAPQSSSSAAAPGGDAAAASRSGVTAGSEVTGDKVS
jgi:hypothetical protein